MTPRVSVDFVSEEMTVKELCTFFLTSSHSRIPVFSETPDDVDYVVTMREALIWKEEGFGEKKLKELDLEKIIKVPSTQPIDRIFTIFQKSHKHIALVLDEHGGVDGVITLEDIIEEVFGDIKDEKDREEEYIRKTSNGAIIVQGSVLVEDVLEEYGLTNTCVNISEEYIGETIGYLILSLLERFPRNGEVLELK
jgi:CBS domain containing-hemolysin-like protein